MVRRARLLVVVGLVGALALSACDPTAPPDVGATTEGPVVFGPDPEPATVAVASESANRAVVWGDFDDDLRFDRFADSTTPVRAQPVTISDETIDGAFDIGWADSSIALGNGYALMTADREESGPFGFFEEAKIVALRSPSDAAVPLTGTAAGDLQWCDEPTNSILARTRVVWSGSTFLVAKQCPGTTQLFTISTAGAVIARSSFGGGTDVELASNGAGFLAVFEATNGAGNVDVRARRLSGTGALVGGAITVAGGFGNQFDPAVGASGSAYLVGWTYNGDGTDHEIRTVGAGGALGTSRLLWSDPLDVFDLSIVGGGGGSFFTAWTEAFGTNGVFGLKVAADGTPANANPTEFSAGQDDQSRPLLTPGPGATAFVTWFKGTGASGDIDLTRKLDADGAPFGPTSRSTRSPFDQTCFDVAAGNGQYLVTWQESRIEGNPNLYAQRYGPNGNPVGAIITLSTAPGDQFCPTAAWNGSKWLVAWTDSRSGTKDVYGTFVSGSGAVSPATGFAISARASQQQSPSVAWNGTQFVVAWNDLRNGNQDVFAARVSPSGAVLDASGIAVTTAAGIQRRPSVASAGGVTLVAWVGDDVQRRLLRSDGTFKGGIVTEGPSYSGTFGTAEAVASPDLLGVLFENGTVDGEGNHEIVVTRTNPETGAKLGHNTVETIDVDHGWIGGDIAYDGTSFSFTSGRFATDGAGTSGSIGTITQNSVLASPSGPLLISARIASLPDQRSLVVDSSVGRILVAPVDDAP